jgi:predicted amidohydrolase
VKIGIVEFRPTLSDKQANVAKGVEIIHQAASKSVDILVFPELWTTGYLVGAKFAALAERIPGPTTNVLAKAASGHGIFLVGGSIPEIGGRRLYNTLFVVDRAGRIIAKHRKAHLWGAYERKYFAPGDRCTVIRTKFATVGLGVCYDGDFQEYSRTLALKGAEIFFNCSAYPSPDEDDWRIFYPCFARQNGFFVVCTNLVGHETGEYARDFYPDGIDFFGESMVIDPLGKMVVQSDPDRQDTGLYVGDVDLGLVKRARGHAFFNLYNRRPELYKPLMRTTVVHSD